MTERTPAELERENAYLGARMAQAESDLMDVTADNQRLREERERLHVRRTARPPNPLGSGQ